MISLPFTGGNRLLRRIHALSRVHGTVARLLYGASWPRDEINCVVQIPITTAESLWVPLSVAFTRSHRRRGLPVKIGVHSSGKRLLYMRLTTVSECSCARAHGRLIEKPTTNDTWQTNRGIYLRPILNAPFSLPA